MGLILYNLNINKEKLTQNAEVEFTILEFRSLIKSKQIFCL